MNEIKIEKQNGKRMGKINSIALENPFGFSE